MVQTRFLILLTLIVFCLGSCKQDDDTPNPGSGTPDNTALYFPGIGSTNWETTSAHELGWDTSKIDELYTFLDDGGTRAFLVLKNGKIVRKIVACR